MNVLSSFFPKKHQVDKNIIDTLNKRNEETIEWVMAHTMKIHTSDGIMLLPRSCDIEVLQQEVCTLTKSSNTNVFSLAATTCVLIAIYERSIGICSFSHLDSSDTCPDILAYMIGTVKKIYNNSKSEKGTSLAHSSAKDKMILEISMIGGMVLHPNGEGESDNDIPATILQSIEVIAKKLDIDVEIKMNVTEYKNTYCRLADDGSNEIKGYPIITDALFDVANGIMIPMTSNLSSIAKHKDENVMKSIQEKEKHVEDTIAKHKASAPFRMVRACRWQAEDSEKEIYDWENNCIRIKPFDVPQRPPELLKQYIYLAEKDPERFLNSFSTSPWCEPPYFVNDVKESMKFQMQHPKFIGDVFPNNDSHVTFKFDKASSTWVRE